MCVLVGLVWFCVFFFKQKTAYEMRISDWSSDVCSSDLNGNPFSFERATGELSMTKSHLLIGAAAFAVAISVSQPALAQDTAAECLDADNNGVCDSDESTERSIVVTGSSLARPTLGSPVPTPTVRDGKSVV